MRKSTHLTIGALLSFSAFLAVLFVPRTVIGQGGTDQPVSGDPLQTLALSGDPGPAASPDLVLDGTDPDIRSVIADSYGVSLAALGSPTVISPASFLDTQFTNDFRFIFNGYIYSNGAPGVSVCAGAPVDLPDGATIAGVTAYAYDNDAAQDIGFWFFKKNFQSTTPEVFAEDFSSAGADPTVRTFTDLTIQQPIVDNAANIFFVYVCMRSPNHRVYAMQVDNTLSAVLPVIKKN